MRNLIIGLAVFEAGLAIVESTVLKAPIIGIARTIDAYNPFIPTLLRAQGTLAHPLVLALFLLVGLALVLAARDLRLLCRAPAIALLIAGCVFTGSSTTVILGMVVIVAFLLLRTGPTVALYTTLWMVILALGLIASNGVPAFLFDDLNERTAQHRLNSFLAVPTLFDGRTAIEVLFGSGSVPDLYARGILVNDGFYAIDNQFVTTFALGGILGVFATGVFALIVVRNTRERLLIVTHALFFLTALSFDFMLWYAGMALFFSVAGITQAHRPEMSLDQFNRSRPSTKGVHLTL